MPSIRTSLRITAALTILLLPSCLPKSDATIDSTRVMDCTVNSQLLICQLIAAWDKEQAPAKRRDEFVHLVTGKVPLELAGPIANCLMVSRANDRGAAMMALHDCLSTVEPNLSAVGAIGRNGLDNALGLAGAMRPTGPRAGAAAPCGKNGGGINPFLAQSSGGYNFGNWPHTSVAPPDDRTHHEAVKNYNEYKNLEKEATQAWQKYVEKLEREADVDYDKSNGNASQADLDAAKKETQDALKEANQAIEKRDEYRPSVSDSKDATTTDDNGTATARTVDGWEDPCLQISDFLAECAASGWKTGPCTIFLAALKGCKSTIMLVDPDQGTGCADVPKTVDAATFAGIMTKVCWQRVKPAGPGEDPCAPKNLDGAVVTVMQPNPCTDPRAMTNPDSGNCDAPFTDPKQESNILLGTATLGDIVATLEKLCACHLPIDVPRPNDPRAKAPLQVVAWTAKSAYRPIP